MIRLKGGVANISNRKNAISPNILVNFFVNKLPWCLFCFSFMNAGDRRQHSGCGLLPLGKAGEAAVMSGCWVISDAITKFLCFLSFLLGTLVSTPLTALCVYTRQTSLSSISPLTWFPFVLALSEICLTLLLISSNAFHSFLFTTPD